MGCDIHIYPEYYSKKDLADEPEKVFVHSICSDYSVGRSYELFGIMAGVRGGDSDCIAPPRGLPDNPCIGWNAAHECSLTVVPDEELKTGNWITDGTVAQSMVDQWRKNGNRILTTRPPGPNQKEIIQHPDYHSYSWLSTQELFEVRRRYLNSEIRFNYEAYNLRKKDVKGYIKTLDTVKDPVELLNHNFGLFEYASLNGLIGMLHLIERTDSDFVGRIVFWFDS